MAIDDGTKNLRVAVVGLRVGKSHLDALAAHPRAEIRAVCDPVEDLAREMARHYSVPGVYADYETMLAHEDLDGVCLATPNRLHAPMTRAAIARGLHVLCEKPLTLDTGEARDLLRMARAAGITHATNFSNRPNPAVRFVKEQIDAGVLGRVYEVHLTYQQDFLGDPMAPHTWRNSRVEGGSGVIGDTGSHMLDLSRLFLGEVASVSAHLGIVTAERARPDGSMAVVDADDLAFASLRYAGGVHGLLRVSRVARGRSDLRRVELYGERASLVLEIDTGINRVWRADEATVFRGDGFRIVFARDPRISTWGGNILEWVDASLERRGMAPSFEDGLRCQEILDAAIRSDAERRWIDV